MAALSVVAVVGAATAAASWYFGLGPAAAGSAPIHRLAEREFAAEGIELGMAADAVRTMHPRIAVRWRRDAGHVGEFVAGGVAYSVWFLPGWKPGPVYRIRYRQVVPRMAAGAVEERFAWQYGGPASVTCRQEDRPGADGACTFTWLSGSGMGLEVVSRDVVGSDQEPLTVLTVTATDHNVKAHTPAEGLRDRPNG